MKIKYRALIPAAVLLLLAACGKDSKILTPKDWVSGSWKISTQGADNNNNGVYDGIEENPVPDSAAITLQLRVNGSGYRVGPNNTYVDSLNWTLLNDDQTLFINLDDDGFIQHLYYQFSFTSNSLTLADTSVKPTFFRYYKRQD
jgi:hypothetical protein